ncbi:MAG: ATP-binding protein [Flavobacteriaceae bacterium]
MIKRRLERKIKATLGRSASIAILGPRQVGKTTLSFEVSETIPSIYLDLENSLDLLKAQDIFLFQKANTDQLIILDEVQRLPHIFKDIRSIIDTERRKGNKTGLFIFLGSASIELLKQSSESLAGRISYLELFPIDVLEFANKDALKTNQLWYRGGFPESLLSEDDVDSFNWCKDFIKTYLERDIPQLGPRIPVETLERFWTMLAHNQGSTFNASQLSRSLDASHTTIIRYLDLMVDLLLVRRLQPYTFNIGKRLIKAPKVYVRDSGITHTLLNIKNYNDLLGNPIVGNSWEGFVIENILAVAPSDVKPYFYRTSGGAEIDLILEFGINNLWAIEIKRSSAPKPSKGFYSACDDLNPKEKFIVYSGTDTFTIKKDITIISLYDMMERLEVL